MDQSNEGQIVIEKNDQGETRARGFNLQPAVVTDDWHDTNNTMASRPGNDANSFFSEDDERGFGLKPVRDRGAFKGSLQDKSQDVGSSVDSTHMELATGALEPRGLDLSPAVPTDTRGRGFDLQPSEDSHGFSLQPVDEARGMKFRVAVDAISESVGDGRGFDLQLAQESRGFNLQPVANLLLSEGEEMRTEEEREGEGEGDEDDDTPPPESLQSIKNIARARKSAGRDSLKKSTDINAAAKKTSKAGKEKSVKKGTTGEKPQHRKEKGKVSGSVVDKSHLFKPSPSSAPSWSPTPTMKNSKTKVRYAYLPWDLNSFLSPTPIFPR